MPASLSRRAVVFALTVSLSVTAHAQPGVDLANEAQLHFDIGVDLYRSGDFRAALEHLLLSNRLVPNKNVVFNIARCFEQLSRFAEAFRYYSDFLDDETSLDAREPAERALERIRPSVALLRIEASIAGATIFVDRRNLGPRGTTPRTLALAPGTYRVILDLEGYESTESDPATVVTGAETVVRLELRRVLGRVEITGEPPGAQIRIDEEAGAPAGRLPATLDLVPGPHVILLSAPGRQSIERVVRVLARRTQRLSVRLPLEFGTVVVSTEERGATVEIDGRAMGTAPAVLTAVPSGSHRLRLTLAGYRPWEEEILVRPNGRTVVEARLRLLQEVTAASRSAESVEQAPASVTLVSQEEIRVFGYQTVYDALGGVRGVFQADDGTYSYLGFRGYSRPGDYGNHMLMLLDGHAMNDDLLGSSYVGYDLRADLLDVERIEVVRGPGSVLYGTNAFFGVINVVTRDWDTMLPPHVSVAAEGVRQARARVGGGLRLSPDSGLWVSAGGLVSQGEDFFFPELGEGTDDGMVRGADDMAVDSALLRAWLRDLTLQASYNDRRKRIPTGAFETVPGDSRAHSDDRRAFAELRWEPRLSSDSRLYLRVYGDAYVFDGAYPYDDPEVGVVRDSWTGLWGGVEGRIGGSLLPWLHATAGTELRVHELAHLSSEDESGRYLDERPHFEVYAGYGVITLTPFPNLTLQAGSRLDYYSSLGPALSPRLSVILRPARDTIVKLLGGRAFRAPSPYELYYNDAGTTQVAPDDNRLSPETIITGEVELTQQIRSDISATAALFVNEIQNLIDTVEVGEGEVLMQYQNLGGRVQTAGCELELRKEWRQGTMLSASYSFQRTRRGSVWLDEDASGESTRLDNSPEHLAGIRAATPLVPGLLIAATRLRLEGPRLTRQLDSETEPVVLWDLVLSGEIRSPKLAYSLGVRNLLDWQYGYPGGWDLEQVTIPQPGRTFFLSATLSF